MAEPDRWEPRRRARRRALQALYQWQITRQPAEEIIEQFLETQAFDGVDTGFFRELVNGVVSGEEELSERLTVCVDRPMAQCDVMERVIILLGAWQLLNDPALPAPILIEESVDLAVRFGSDQSPGFVNGVLDRAAREWRGADAGH
jgi:N utilization substance protein B